MAILDMLDGYAVEAGWLCCLGWVARPAVYKGYALWQG
jgi:hypothetical protein